MEVILLALVASLGLAFTLFKIFGLNALRYDWFFDVLFTVALPICLSGSYNGMVLAIFSGIFLSIELFIMKKMLGRQLA